ncbi:putative toxoplasma gondii family C protein [Toxoplasma gondii]|uniref:Putative toxoplasma gondii family C protein n=1 Tax=Toxoplasma gondii TaxID=5811 RepID=A0A7J6KHC5_TOXGO|nr:putative toxoplasma gondii family C protein [Toxoplasma gondii]
MEIAMHDDGWLEEQGLDIRRSVRTIHPREGLHLMCVVPIFMDPSPPDCSGVLDVRKVVDAHNTKLLYGSESNESSLPEMKRDVAAAGDMAINQNDPMMVIAGLATIVIGIALVSLHSKLENLNSWRRLNALLMLRRTNLFLPRQSKTRVTTKECASVLNSGVTSSESFPEDEYCTARTLRKVPKGSITMRIGIRNTVGLRLGTATEGNVLGGLAVLKEFYLMTGP